MKMLSSMWIKLCNYRKILKNDFEEKKLFISEAFDKLEDGKIHDDYRIDYMNKHLTEMKKSVEIDGVELLGYTAWGCIDLVSAGTGEMKKRYGFVYVDRFNDGHGTLERKLKDSYYRYKEIIESNGEVLLEDE